MKALSFLSFVYLLLLNGCATEAKYEAAVDRWIGSKSTDLTEVFGPPDDIRTFSNESFYMIYNKKKFTDQILRPERIDKTLRRKPPNVSYLWHLLLPIWEYHITPELKQTIEFHCRTTFEVNSDDIIIRTSFYGNSCRSK